MTAPENIPGLKEGESSSLLASSLLMRESGMVKLKIFATTYVFRVSSVFFVVAKLALPFWAE